MQIKLCQLREFLKDEFSKRKSFRPLYSKRAFARDTGISLTSLNAFLAGARDLNLKNVDKVFKYLKKQNKPACSWCGAPKSSTKVLIGGPLSQFICDQCVQTCTEILRTGRRMPR